VIAESVLTSSSGQRIFLSQGADIYEVAGLFDRSVVNQVGAQALLSHGSGTYLHGEASIGKLQIRHPDIEGVTMKSVTRFAVCGAVASALAACGGSSGSGSMGSTVATQEYGSVPVVMSDDASQDWATIGVKVLSIALIPQGGGSNVVVYSAPTTTVPYTNLAQLDQLGELLGDAQVPVGTYTGAVIIISGNPGDVLLTASADPEAGFSLAAGTAVPTADIQIQHTQGSAPNLIVPITLGLVSPLVVTTSSTGDAIDIEFDLAHPAFILGHMPPGATATQWAVNFSGPLRHHPLADLRRLVLRHTYGTVTAISNDNTSITISKDFPTLPAVSPETDVPSSISLSILADATNGTLLYDVDAKTVTTITSFTGQSSLDGQYVRIAARYQENGTLVATRIWASTSFNNVWVSPEGHVLDVNSNTNVITITNEAGVGVPLSINGSTKWFFRQPWNAVADATPIATGTAFLASQDIVRGYKVHASVVDPLATPLVAQGIDIETAEYSGAISQSNSSGFTTTHNFVRSINDYSVALDFISSATANGDDPITGNAITSFKFWNFAYPTLVDASSSDFVAATDGAVSFGGSAAAIVPWAVSYTIWGDPANSTGWSAAASILEPTPLPVATVATAPATAGSGLAFTITVIGGTQPVSVDVSNNSGSAALVYQVDNTDGVVTVSPIDITTSSGLATFTSGLAAGSLVRVYGQPQASGTFKSYLVTYFTGTTPAS
jgi:Domain of unknown function (DUF5666)